MKLPALKRNPPYLLIYITLDYLSFLSLRQTKLVIISLFVPPERKAFRSFGP